MEITFLFFSQKIKKKKDSNSVCFLMYRYDNRLGAAGNEGQNE